MYQIKTKDAKAKIIWIPIPHYALRGLSMDRTIEPLRARNSYIF